MGGGHAAYEEEFVGVDTAFFGVEEFVANVDAFDDADNHAVVADVQGTPFGAFEAGGGFKDARRFDHGRRRGVEAGAVEFVFAVRQRSGALVHGFGDGFIHEVDDEFVGGSNIEGGVLGRVVIAVAGGEDADGGLGTHNVEEAERRGVDLAAIVHGGDQRDGPRCDEADEKLVGAVGVFVFEIKLHARNIKRKAESEKGLTAKHAKYAKNWNLKAGGIGGRGRSGGGEAAEAVGGDEGIERRGGLFAGGFEDEGVTETSEVEVGLIEG